VNSSGSRSGSIGSSSGEFSRRELLRRGVAAGLVVGFAVPTGPARGHAAVRRQAGRRPVDTAWLARPIRDGDSGQALSDPEAAFSPAGWLKASVPGTALATLVAAEEVPDPYYGLNNRGIKDAGVLGGLDAYTFWYRAPLPVPSDSAVRGGRVFLDLLGINYRAWVYINGIALTPEEAPLIGMFLRHRLDITDVVRPGEHNLVAVLVQPPDPPAIPKTSDNEPAGTSCQVFDGPKEIGRSVVNQVSAGWDFWQPVRDRNAGLWDEVALTMTGPLVLDSDPQIKSAITWSAPGEASAATVTARVAVSNAGSTARVAVVEFTLGDRRVRQTTQVSPGETSEVVLSVKVPKPRLWWVSGYGEPALYDAAVTVQVDGRVSDAYRCAFGIREVCSTKDTRTGGRRFTVNGVPVFIRGGAWVAADALLRLSDQDYDDQVRLHQEANLNLIRVWGGSITERKAFYDACDRRGILVWQEFWVTGDCAPTTWNPVKNPQDHDLFRACAHDAVRMLRNHASLCLWVGGNEGAPPGELDTDLGKIVADEDKTRPYVSFSTDFEAGLGADGNPYSDGPYAILYPSQFFDGTWNTNGPDGPLPFTPETGSVGTPVAETIRAMMHAKDADHFPQVIQETWLTNLNKTWFLHLFIPYFKNSSTALDHTKDQLLLYGQPANLEQFCEQAQAAQYQQYKAMFEGRNARMWCTYTGGILWRSAPGWSVLRGLLYDHLKEQTGGYWGVRKAGEPLHPQFDLHTQEVAVVNNMRQASAPASLEINVCGPDGRIRPSRSSVVAVPPIKRARARVVAHLSSVLEPDRLHLLVLRLFDRSGRELAHNTDWFYAAANPQPDDAYAPLRALAPVELRARGKGRRPGGEWQLELTLSNPSPVCAFQVRLQLLDCDDKRLTPFFASDNYLTVLPGTSRVITLATRATGPRPHVYLSGWNVAGTTVPVRWR
jgi:mannosylglycoprotein endo-beta-mannosidase